MSKPIKPFRVVCMDCDRYKSGEEWITEPKLNREACTLSHGLCSECYKRRIIELEASKSERRKP